MLVHGKPRGEADAPSEEANARDPWRWRRAAALLAGCLVALPAKAGDPLTLIVSGMDKQIYLPVRLADRLGYFKDADIDVELLSEEAGVNARDQLLLGHVEGVVGFYDHTIDLQAKGKQVESVVQFTRAPGEALVVPVRAARRIASVEDLRNQAVGVTGVGSSTDYLARYLLLSRGARPGEVTTLGVGSAGSFTAALASGRILAGMTSEPTVSTLVRSGQARILVDLRTPSKSEAVLGGPYPGACLYMSTAWVRTHKPLVRRLAAAFVKALRFIATHDAEEVARAAGPEAPGLDKAAYVAGMRETKSAFTADGRMPPSGPATVVKVLRLSDNAVGNKAIDVARTWTDEFVGAVR
ncbi:MAG: ABC transporter substrate-binding protein [Burkholderiaceae bacterium]